MGNSILTNSIITKKALMELKNQLGFTKGVNREYSAEFAQSGAKVGDTINIRKPDRYEVTDGAALTIQDSVNRSVALQLDKHKHVGMAFSEKDRTLSIDKFTELYIAPAITAIANQVDYDGLQLYKQVYNSVGVPSASAFASDTKAMLAAKQKILEGGGPKGMYNGIVSPAVEAAMVYGMKGLFQSSEKIAEQYEQGVLGIAAGAKWMSSQNVAMHTIGQLGGTPVMNGSTAEGATTLVTDGWTNSAANRLKKGDVISIGSVYAVNPQNRQSTGALAQFVVAADVDSDSGGNATITLDRAIYASGKMKNVDSLPQDGAAITTFGHASSYASVVAPQSMLYHKNAFVLGTADFELPDAGCKAARASDPESGLSLSMVSQYDVQNHRTIHRLDILYGWKCVYADLACRIVGQPA